MRIGVLAPAAVPPTLGGLDRALEGLVRAVNERTLHEAELVRVPVEERTLVDIVRGYETFAGLDASRFDLVVTSKYPAWLVEHPNHIVYMFHRLRGVYDSYRLLGLPDRVDHRDPDLARLQRLVRSGGDRRTLDEFFELFAALVRDRGSDDPALAFPGPFAREVVHFLDRIALEPRSIRRFFALSQTVAARRGYFPPGARVEVVYMPAPVERARCDGFRHFFTVSRLDVPKRIDLIIRAMAFVSHDVPLKIAGAGPDFERLRAEAADDDRISFVGAVTDQELVDLYADALAVPFVPFDEDLGLVTLEAMASSKPVVTCRDSGGPTEFVLDGVTGYVTDPTPAAVGDALDCLAGDHELARRLGRGGYERGRPVSWDRTVRALLHMRPSRRAERPRRPRGKVVVLATFGIHPARHGGQLRLLQLCRGLAERFDVEVITLAEEGALPTRDEVAAGIVQVAVPKSAAHAEAEVEISRTVGWLPVTDVAATELISLTPEYVAAVESAAAAAAAIALSHPYLFPVLGAITPTLPLVYEAQDVETELKRQVLPRTEAGARLYDVVERVEAAVVRAAALTVACSAEDADTLAQLFGVDRDRFLVVPNGTDVSGTPLVVGAARRRSRDRWLHSFRDTSGTKARVDRLAIFVGSWHPPNVDAAEVIVDVAPSHPRTLFVLGGSHCDAFERRRLADNVLVAGVVSDLGKRALLQSADVALNPMRTGSGTNLKLVEYLAAGVPVVTTAIGARGLHGDDPPVVVAEVHDFAAAIQSVYDEGGAATERTRRGRELVVAAYDWSTLRRRFADGVERVAGVAA